MFIFNSDLISYTSTMSAVEVKKAQNNLTCPVCYQLFKNPKYLPCYHSYCEGCLEKMQVQSKIICPECRKEAEVPAGGVKELATNFFINRLVDDLILKKKWNQLHNHILMRLLRTQHASP